MPKRVNDEGQVWAIPVGRFGFCPAVVARSADPSDPVGFSLIYVWPTPTDELSNPDDLPTLRDWGTAWVGLVARRPFSTKRWTLVGSIGGFDRDEWPMPPWSEWASRSEDAVAGWSVATSGEIPSMTVIANDPVTREVGEVFPPWAIVTAPSALEKGLTNHLKESDGSVFDMAVEPIDVDPERVRQWREYGAEVRSRDVAIEPDALPAGRRTDRSLAGGEWLAFPARGGGFGAGLFMPRPPEHSRVFSDGLVLVFGRVWSTWPTLAQARELTIDDAVALGQTSMICVRDGRWRVLGRDTPFDADRWPLPMWWTVGDTGASVDIRTADGVLNIPVDPEVLERDPEAGSCWSRSGVSYSSLEVFPAGKYATDYMVDSFGVTPARIQTWRQINRHIESALGRPASTLWIDD